MKKITTISTLLFLFALTFVAMPTPGSAQTTTSLRRLVCDCRPSKVVHFWRFSLPVSHPGTGPNIILSALPDNVSSNGLPGGTIIKDGRNLVITNIDMGPGSPDLVRVEQAGGAWERILAGSASQGFHGALVVEPDEALGAGLGLRGTGTPWTGTVSISGYWIAN